MLLRAFSIVLLLLSGHSRAAPAIPHQKCTSDFECNRGEFCRQKFGPSYCTPCLECNLYNREPSATGCAILRTDCGLCLPGFRELIPRFCSRLVKANMTSKSTDQTPKLEPWARVDQSQDSCLCRLLYVAAISAIFVIVMAISFGYYDAVPEDAGVVNIHNNNAPLANNGDHEGLLALLENEIDQAFVPNPHGQIPDVINNDNELNEEPIDLEQFAGDDYPIAMNENHDDDFNEVNQEPMDVDNHDGHHIDINDNNDHHMDQNNVPNVPQGPLEEHEFELSDQIVPDFPPMENSAQNPPPQGPQQLAQVMREVYEVVMFINDEE